MPKFDLPAYLARVKALPVTLGHIEKVVTDSIPVVEEVAGDIKLTASHQHMPLLGNVYAISIFEEGPKAVAERRLMRSALIRELGEPRVEDVQESGVQLFFMSDDQSLPRTEVHRRLGDQRLAELCAGLSVEERVVVDEALAAMEVFLRHLPNKMKALSAIVSKLPDERIKPVSLVLERITYEFMMKRPHA